MPLPVENRGHKEPLSHKAPDARFPSLKGPASIRVHLLGRRVLRDGFRRGDNSVMGTIELV